MRDESLEDSANLPDPHILAAEIADDLRSALGQIEDILEDLEERVVVHEEVEEEPAQKTSKKERSTPVQDGEAQLNFFK